MPSTNKDKILEKIKNARSLNDVLSSLDLIDMNIKSMVKATSRILSSLSNQTITINLKSTSAIGMTEREGADLDVDVSKLTKGKTGRKKPSGEKSIRAVLDANTLKIPKQSDLVKNSSLVQEHDDTLVELRAALRTLKSKEFAKLDDNRDIISGINARIKHVEKLRADHLKELAKLGQNNTPKEHTSVVKNINKILSVDLKMDSYIAGRPKTFVLSPNKDTIWFQTFIVLMGVTTVEGFVYEEYAYVLTGSLNMKDGEMSFYLTTIKSGKPPGSFPIGKEVETLSALRSHVKRLNANDNLQVKETRVKMPLNTQQLTTNIDSRDEAVLKNFKKNIKSMRIHKNKLYVQIDRSLNERQEKNLVESLIAAFRTIFVKRSRTRRLEWKLENGRNSNARFLIIGITREVSDNEMEFKKRLNKLARDLDQSPQSIRLLLQDASDVYD